MSWFKERSWPDGKQSMERRWPDGKQSVALEKVQPSYKGIPYSYIPTYQVAELLTGDPHKNSSSVIDAQYYNKRQQPIRPSDGKNPSQLVLSIHAELDKLSRGIVFHPVISIQAQGGIKPILSVGSTSSKSEFELPKTVRRNGQNVRLEEVNRKLIVEAESRAESAAKRYYHLCGLGALFGKNLGAEIIFDPDTQRWMGLGELEGMLRNCGESYENALRAIGLAAEGKTRGAEELLHPRGKRLIVGREGGQMATRNVRELSLNQPIIEQESQKRSASVQELKPGIVYRGVVVVTTFSMMLTACASATADAKNFLPTPTYTTETRPTSIPTAKPTERPTQTSASVKETPTSVIGSPSNIDGLNYPSGGPYGPVKTEFDSANAGKRYKLIVTNGQYSQLQTQYLDPNDKDYPFRGSCVANPDQLLGLGKGETPVNWKDRNGSSMKVSQINFCTLSNDKGEYAIAGGRGLTVIFEDRNRRLWQGELTDDGKTVDSSTVVPMFRTAAEIAQSEGYRGQVGEAIRVELMKDGRIKVVGTKGEMALSFIGNKKTDILSTRSVSQIAPEKLSKNDLAELGKNLQIDINKHSEIKLSDTVTGVIVDAKTGEALGWWDYQGENARWHTLNGVKEQIMSHEGERYGGNTLSNKWNGGVIKKDGGNGDDYLFCYLLNAPNNQAKEFQYDNSTGKILQTTKILYVYDAKLLLGEFITRMEFKGNISYVLDFTDQLMNEVWTPSSGFRLEDHPLRQSGTWGRLTYRYGKPLTGGSLKGDHITEYMKYQNWSDATNLQNVNRFKRDGTMNGLFNGFFMPLSTVLQLP